LGVAGLGASYDSPRGSSHIKVMVVALTVVMGMVWAPCWTSVGCGDEDDEGETHGLGVWEDSCGKILM